MREDDAKGWGKSRTGLLLSSKTIFNETLPVLYSETIFVHDLEKPQSVKENPQFFSSIKHLGLDLKIDHQKCLSDEIGTYTNKLLDWIKALPTDSKVQKLHFYAYFGGCCPLRELFQPICDVLFLLTSCYGNYAESPKLYLTIEKFPSEPSDMCSKTISRRPYVSLYVFSKQLTLSWKQDVHGNIDSVVGHSIPKPPEGLRQINIVTRIPTTEFETFYTELCQFKDKGYLFRCLEATSLGGLKHRLEFIWEEEVEGSAS